ncbi:MAG: metalloregulator ArsR/SmtB family transcription factor [Acidobacteria bacterium]|nr:metalloregulator ArsR/SmtB family transcription factor [Acidobacteriota bacterium]
MSKEKPFDMELFFAALADRTRLRLLNLIGNEEICVCFLTEVIDTNQPKISRHLAYLKRAGLVSVRRDWKWSHYRIVKPPHEGAAKVLEATLAWIRDEPEMQRDRQMMANIGCRLSEIIIGSKTV